MEKTMKMVAVLLAIAAIAPALPTNIAENPPMAATSDSLEVQDAEPP
jgi:hypothetical protein